MARGYFGIGIYHPKTELNIGTLWRSAQNFGAAFIFTIGRRYQKQSSDTTKAYRHIPLFHYKDFSEFNRTKPYSCHLIAVEQNKRSVDIGNFIHPEQAIYLLGAEDHGIPPQILTKCQAIISINTPHVSQCRSSRLYCDVR